MDKKDMEKIWSQMIGVVHHLGNDAISMGHETDCPMDLLRDIINHLEEGFAQGHTLHTEDGQVKINWGQE